LEDVTMTVFPSLARLLAAGCSAALLLPSAADAAETRYVATNGNNNNGCTLSEPCRTLQRGVDMTPNGGELIVLDPGSYGDSLFVNQSITISADGVTVTMLDPGRITIDGADVVVVLRGLHLKAARVGFSGIQVQRATAVHIERCTIEGFDNGMFVSDTQLFVTDSIVRDNGHGLFALSVRLTVDNSRFDNNRFNGALLVDGNSTIARSIFSRNGQSGIAQEDGRMSVAWTTAANNSMGYRVLGGGHVTLVSSVARGNSMQGLYVVSGMVTISRSVFTDNGTGIQNDSGGTVQRLPNNILRGNGTNLLNNGGTIPNQVVPF
jgi:hypothetical protein